MPAAGETGGGSAPRSASIFARTFASYAAGSVPISSCNRAAVVTDHPLVGVRLL